jgi:tetratricopeptide (TPR) repeat protein
MITHYWYVGARPATATALAADCHRRLRGPYTGVGTVLRTLVPQAQQDFRDLVHRYAIEILSIAPELRATVDAPPETLASVAAPEEQTRIYPALRTRRLSHGIVDFLAACAAPERLGPLELIFVNLDEADHTDQECLSLLLRRIPADRVRITVHTRTTDLPGELTQVLGRHAVRVDLPPPPAPPETRDADILLRAYVESDGTSDDPAELAAYEAADPARRATLHDERAAVLRERDEITLTLGAIAYHAEHGSDPAVTGGEALLDALQYAVSMGFHHAVIDYGRRGRAIVDPKTQMDIYWPLTGRSATALAATGRPEQAEPLYLEVRRRYAVPMVHLVNSYALGMLYARHYGPERRDYAIARTYVNTAIAIATILPEPVPRAFLTAFNSNGLALIEMREGNLDESLRIVAEGLELVRTAVPDETHRLHKSVLMYNMASLHSRMGRLAEALAGYTKVLAVDPNWQDYYFERADVLRRLGDPHRALADYDAAELVTPPFWELHFNRGGLRAEVGDFAGAIADLERVVDLEPGEVEAWANLAAIISDSGDPVGARRRIDDALLVHPGNPRLLCIRGQFSLAANDIDRAWQDFEAALAADGELPDALACHAGIAFDRGDAQLAVRDLTRAVELTGPDPDLLFNRAQARQSLGQWGNAIADYTRALNLPGSDRVAILRQRGICHQAAGQLALGQDDLTAAERIAGQSQPVPL